MSSRLFLFALLTLTCLRAADAPKGTKPAIIMSAPAEVVKELFAIEEAWVKAEINHDAATLERILDDQFLTTSASGRTKTKEEFIDQFRGPAKDTSWTQTLEDRIVRADGDTAILVETDTVRQMDQGKEVVTKLRLTVTYIRRNGQWRALAEHFTKVK